MNVAIDQTRMEKRAIFEVSLRLLKEGKFHATPMAEIAYLSKMSDLLMEHVFESREKLLTELSEMMIRKIETKIQEASAQRFDFKDRVFDCWIALYQFYTRFPDMISFVEQFDNVKHLPSPLKLVHPGRSSALIDLFTEQEQIAVETAPETLAWLLHENALSAAKMNVLNANYSMSPERLAEFFWNGLIGPQAKA